MSETEFQVISDADGGRVVTERDTREAALVCAAQLNAEVGLPDDHRVEEREVSER